MTKSANVQIYVKFRVQKLKAKASRRRPQKYENHKKSQNENPQKFIILEGFSQNELQIRIQRIFLRIVAPVKIYFRHLFEYVIF